MGTNFLVKRNTKDINNSIIKNDNAKVTYSDLLEITNDLCRTVADNPVLSKSTYGTIYEWINKLREGKNFEVIFNNKALPKESNDTDINQPLPAVIPPLGSGSHKR